MVGCRFFAVVSFAFKVFTGYFCQEQTVTQSSLTLVSSKGTFSDRMGTALTRPGLILNELGHCGSRARKRGPNIKMAGSSRPS